ncbi:hypothetical protein V6R21_25320 [Limibacter armeniacum]|uniref:DUF6436 domain-containing protein n=1 Tax=Limibacter armeniacum TaxID=466084 RepID=UPI002FE53F80
MKKLLVLVLLVVQGCIVATIFWEQEYKYVQPTPIPENHREVEVGSNIDFSHTALASISTPLFIHYFNDECPCSRFNLKHFRSIYNKHKNDLNFVVVVEDGKDPTTIAEAFPEGIHIITDTPDAKIALVCGIYATPQAVIIDQQHQLYYKGNFNKARYCTQPTSNYAQQAVEDFIGGKPAPFFGWSAVQAYGCSLSVYDSSNSNNIIQTLLTDFN